MISAFAVSTVFLISYLLYHYRVGHVVFQGQGWIRPVYFVLLTSHTILAIVIVPMILITLRRALAGELRPAPHHCALDAAAVVLCLRDRRDRLPDGLSNLRAKNISDFRRSVRCRKTSSL